MNAVPHIMVQLVHIEGPLKGEIQDLHDAEIVIGRHPDCQVRFPKDLVILSRRHARIVREGNRFKLIDQSTNGTYVNGRQVPEAYLKDGDVITFAEGGPKLSFLTQVSDQPMAAPQPVPEPPRVSPPVAPAPQTPAAPAAPVAPAAAAPVPPPPGQAPVAAPQAPISPVPAVAPPSVEPVKAPFAIQYGAALKSFQTLPITLGKGAGCHFIINHPALMDQQAQIFFSQGQYWIKDLTGANMVQIDGMPIAGPSALQPDMQIGLSPQGPKFRFLGGGRFAEIEDPIPAPAVPAAPQPPGQPGTPVAPEKPESVSEKAGALFKKFFK